MTNDFSRPSFTHQVRLGRNRKGQQKGRRKIAAIICRQCQKHYNRSVAGFNKPKAKIAHQALLKKMLHNWLHQQCLQLAAGSNLSARSAKSTTQQPFIYHLLK